MNIVVELKKCCNHPFLFESADHGYGGDSSSQDGSKLERIILSSGKLVILDKLLVRLHETKHRVLIFSQVCGQYNYAVYASLTLNYQDYQLNIMLARLSPCQCGAMKHGYVFLVPYSILGRDTGAIRNRYGLMRVSS